MFRAPDVYKMGMAVAPVADVHNYDTIYQERYVGLPSTDSAAYRDASAVNFATGLRGDLLVVHGSGDDNVHYQGTEQLINALVAARKAISDDGVPEPHARHLRRAGTSLHLFTLLTRLSRTTTCRAGPRAATGHHDALARGHSARRATTGSTREARRAGHHAGHRACDTKHQRGTDHDAWIAGGDSIELGADRARRHDRERRTDDDADACHRERLPHDEP